MAQSPPESRTGPAPAEPSRDRQKDPMAGLLYCPTCAREVSDPLTCGDCSAVICRVCGTPLESPDDLAFG